MGMDDDKQTNNGDASVLLDDAQMMKLKEQDELDVAVNHTPHLRLIDGISVIFGLMVGSGIFSSSGLVFADVGSAGMSLVIWFITGLLALTGALW